MKMIEFGKPRNYIISAVIVAVCFIALRPALAYLLYKRAGDYMSSFMVANAARTYEKTLFFNNDDIDSRNWLAYCYSLTGRKEKAVAEYKKVIALDPGDMTALFDLGMIYKKDGDLKQAKGYFARAAAAGQGPNVTDQNYKFYKKSAGTMLEVIERLEKKNNP
jgi:Flp pilus assembly protein TadD